MSTVLITGASSGIGYELAKVCANNGHDLVLVARSDITTTHPVFSTVSVVKIKADLSTSGAAKRLVSQLKRRSITIDIIINNAGFGSFGEFKDMDVQAATDMVQLNCIALTELSGLILPQMLHQKGGKILNVASTAAFLPGPMMAVYYATKHYVLAFSEGLSEELRGSGVTVTALCPGATESNFAQVADAEHSNLFKNKKLPTAREVADYGYWAMMREKRVAVHGIQNKIMSQLPRLLPRWLAARAVYWFSTR